MKKSISVHYDDVNDKDLLEFIDESRCKSSRSAFIMNMLYDFKKGKLNYGLKDFTINEFIKKEPLVAEIEDNEDAKIDKETVDDFKKKFGK